MMFLTGKIIKLRPAELADRKKVYEWMAQSDITPAMMGPPEYPEHPVPAWEEFCGDYREYFFNPDGDGSGRNYIIIAGGHEVGTVGYDLLDMARNRVVLDIWMSSEKNCGHGYGSDALNTLCEYIYKRYGITRFLISPSARNKRAVSAYEKCGFRIVSETDSEFLDTEFGVSEYSDNLLMIKALS